MLRRALAAFFLLAAALPLAGTTPDASWRRVVIEPTWTSIYVGTVSLRMPEFNRNSAGEFESSYSARVLPWFFQNESGRLAIAVTDDALRRLAGGESIDFTGHAANHTGQPRGITGRATPVDITSGRIKVRVRVSASVELIFNTTYRFTGN
ncbi:MAG: hypothetical protein RIR76_785 [Verrucomicrobiota bacterium]|nr:hypothetical protein [Opitutaceae bacterium]